MNNIGTIRVGFQDMRHTMYDTFQKIGVGVQKIRNRVHTRFQEVKSSSQEICEKSYEKAAAFWEKHEWILCPVLVLSAPLGILALVSAVSIPIILFAPPIFCLIPICLNGLGLMALGVFWDKF